MKLINGCIFPTSISIIHKDLLKSRISGNHDEPRERPRDLVLLSLSREILWGERGGEGIHSPLPQWPTKLEELYSWVSGVTVYAALADSWISISGPRSLLKISIVYIRFRDLKHWGLKSARDCKPYLFSSSLAYRKVLEVVKYFGIKITFFLYLSLNNTLKVKVL